MNVSNLVSDYILVLVLVSVAFYARVTNLEKSKENVGPSKVEKGDAHEDILTLTKVIVKSRSDYDVQCIEKIAGEDYINNA